MDKVRLIKPYVSFPDIEAEFREIFESGIFTRGKFVEQFAEDIKSYTGAEHCFLTTSATTSLWLCLKLLGIGPGDEVVVSDFSFPATANVVEDLGARPVFADVSPDTYNMTVETLTASISKATKAIIFVDALGNPSGLDVIKETANALGIPLIEDAACAIGSSIDGQKCGSIADMTCFSFHPRKLISTGEGGAITTNNAQWADWLTAKLFHGAAGMKGIALDFVDYGYNFRMSELQAAMGISQLVRLDAIVDQRLRTRAQYVHHLAPLGFVPQQVDANVRHNVQSVVFKVPDSIDRDRLVIALRDTVETTIGTYAMSGLTYYETKYGCPNPVSTKLQECTLTLPCFEGVDVALVCDAVQQAIKSVTKEFTC
ncbi:DegT/DnrJ/EryC1/StrS family aminotransferase [Rhodobacteraceae bacterium XHP0102]|nr:DegT/DnrJ/EryC1/StrS family aminotransferase [Rhodobacteraceae bacterium XHP0102]